MKEKMRERVATDQRAGFFEPESARGDGLVKGKVKWGFGVVKLEALGETRGLMSTVEATAEIFIRAFKALKPRERDAVLEKIVSDRALAEDLAAALLLEKRRRQPRERFRDVLKELRIFRVNWS